jgi:exosortase family protein XrtF
VIRNVSSVWKQIPKTVRVFFGRALLLFVGWKTIYLILLLPGRVLDGPLTYSVAVLTTKTLNAFSPSHNFSVISALDTSYFEGSKRFEHQMQIYQNKDKTLAISDECNALEIFVLYAGFIICFPASTARKLRFILIGFALIYLLNIIRCAALVFIDIHYHEYLDISHHFVFTFIVYAFIFLLWHIFAKKLRLNARLSK